MWMSCAVAGAGSPAALPWLPGALPVVFLLQEVFMSQYNIAVIVGSLRKDSFNRKLATALARLAPADFRFTQVRLDGLPPSKPAKKG